MNSISRIDFLQGEVEERGTDAAGQAGQDRDDAARRTQEGRQRHATHLTSRRQVKFSAVIILQKKES